MAVFTAVSQSELEAWLSTNYDLGKIVDFKGITGGIENSNFFVSTVKDGHTHHLVLTLFERLSHEQLPFYLYLMQYLAERDITVPDPIVGKDGQILRDLNGKPATLVTRLPGESKLQPLVTHCEQVGRMLAKMHLAGKDYPRQQANLRSLPWWQETVPEILPHLHHAPASLAALLQSELAYQTQFFASADYHSLPSGPSHCDLFRDNVLFESVTQNGEKQDQLGGFFDFYFAGCDKWLFDLAVTVNDWCIDLTTGELDWQRATAMLNAYHAELPLTETDKRCWKNMLRAAAYRFWVSRLWDWYLPRQAEMLQPHNPKHFEHVLQARIESQQLPWITV